MNGFEFAAAQAPSLFTRYGGPLGVAGKLVGLGQEEVEAGVPWWAWAGVGAIVGGLLVYAGRDKIERVIEGPR